MRSATLALIDETHGQPVTCKGKKRDRYGRLIAVCYAGTFGTAEQCSDISGCIKNNCIDDEDVV